MLLPIPNKLLHLTLESFTKSAFNFAWVSKDDITPSAHQTLPLHSPFTCCLAYITPCGTTWRTLIALAALSTTFCLVTGDILSRRENCQQQAFFFDYQADDQISIIMFRSTSRIRPTVFFQINILN